jgi:hypothetical protein
MDVGVHEAGIEIAFNLLVLSLPQEVNVAPNYYFIFRRTHYLSQIVPFATDEECAECNAKQTDESHYHVLTELTASFS